MTIASMLYSFTKFQTDIIEAPLYTIPSGIGCLYMEATFEALEPETELEPSQTTTPGTPVSLSWEWWRTPVILLLGSWSWWTA